MANTTSNNNALEEFVSSLKEAKTILQDIEEQKKELTGREDKYLELEKKKIKKVYEDYNSNKKNPYSDEKDMVSKVGMDAINQYYEKMAIKRLTHASQTLYEKGNLEKILSSIDPNNDEDKKKLENLLLNEETAQVIHASVSKDYNEWLEYYNKYLSARALEEKAKVGKLNDDERAALAQGYATEVVEGAREADKNKNTKAAKHILEDMYALVYQMAIRSATPDKLKEGARRIVQEAEKRLRDYEEKNNITAKEYVTSAIKKLASGSAEEFALARELTYQLVEHKVK